MSVSWPVSVDVAVRDAEIGLAWADRDLAGPAVRFVRLTPNLELISTSKLDDIRPDTQRTDVAVAPLPSGWIVGVGNPDGVMAILLDAMGAFAARTIVDPPPIAVPGEYGRNPVVATRAGAGPLIAWRNGNSLRAAVIASDGRSATTPIELTFDGWIQSGSLSAVFFDDAFYVGFIVSHQFVSSQLRLARVAADGTTSTTFPALAGDSVNLPSLVAGATGLSIVYEGAAPGHDGAGMVWRRISVTGEALGSRVLVGPPERYLNFSPAAAVGGDIVVLASGYGAGLGFARALGIVRIDSRDQITRPVFDFALGPGMGSYSIVPRGRDLIVAWLGGGFSIEDRIGIAKLLP